MRTYDVLGCPGKEDIAEVIEVALNRLTRDRQRLAAQQTQSRYESLLTSYYTIIQYKHLAFDVDYSSICVIEEASQLATEYYSGQWEIDAPNDKRFVEKIQGNCYFNWLELYTDSLQFALLGQDRTLLSLMGNYIEPWFGPGWHVPYELNPLYANLLLSIGCAFRNETFTEIDDLESEVLKCNDKTLVNLLSSWIAARNGDSEKFASSMRESLLYFEKGLKKPLLFSRQAIAEYHSIVFNAATHFEIEVPEFEPKVMARLLTSRSIGLE